MTSPLGFNALPIVRQVVEQPVISLMEQLARGLLQHCVDVSGTGGIFATLKPSAELTCTSPHMLCNCNGAQKSLISATCWKLHGTQTRLAIICH